MSKFDIRRASREQLDELNRQIRISRGVEPTVRPVTKLDTSGTEVHPEPIRFDSGDVQDLSRCVKDEATFQEKTKTPELSEAHLEFNFGPL